MDSQPSAGAKNGFLRLGVRLTSCVGLLLAGGVAGGGLAFISHGHTLLFAGVVLLLLVADQLSFNRKDHVMSTWEAVYQSMFWVALGLGFGVYTYLQIGEQKGIEFFTGYFIEKALSVDNLFVFIVLFSFFKVPDQYRHKVLFWGIIGAKIMRFILIAAGAALVSLVHAPLLYALVALLFMGLIWFARTPQNIFARLGLWGGLGAGAVWLTATLVGPHIHSWGILGHDANLVLMFFGILLLGSAAKLWSAGEEEAVEPDKNPVVKWVANHAPMTDNYVGSKFLVRTGRFAFKLTPLFLVLIAIEVTDLMFATDSIPAIFAVSKDPFILYTSNVCAILGLRAMYFMLEKGMASLVYLQKALVFVLGFIGIKLVADPLFHIPIAWALGVVLVTIGGAVALSLLFPPKGKDTEEAAK